MASTDSVPQDTQIPIIDISDTASESRIADELVQAAIIHGFVYIKNLGDDIPITEIHHAFELVCL
jgi:isopenicillin N synthase-like dioxygenase